MTQELTEHEHLPCYCHEILKEEININIHTRCRGIIDQDKLDYILKTNVKKKTRSKKE